MIAGIGTRTSGRWLAALRSPLRAGFARVRRQPQLAFAFLQHAGLAF